MDVLAEALDDVSNSRSATRSARSAPRSPKPNSSPLRPVPATDPPLISSPQHKAKAPPRQVESLRLQWVRQRCQEAPDRTASIASTRPAWALEATSWTPDRLRVIVLPRPGCGGHDETAGSATAPSSAARSTLSAAVPRLVRRWHGPTGRRPQLPGCQPAESMPTAPERCLARGPLTKPERMACQWQV